MHTIGIMGSGPEEEIPHLADYAKKIDLWIGVDRGTLILMNNHIEVNYAIGDFDSVTKEEKTLIQKTVLSTIVHPAEKDQSDLELAIRKALTLNPKEIYLFGVTGGRLDHGLINIQLLLPVIRQHVRGMIVNDQNIIEMTMPKLHHVKRDEVYPYISFVPFSEHVTGLTLSGFYYPLNDYHLSWGSTLCLSNKLVSNCGTFSYEEGILLLIKSRDSSVMTPS